MDSELNSVSQNSSVFTPRCKFSCQFQLVRVSDASQTVKTPVASIVLFVHLSPHRAACPQVLFFWMTPGLAVAESCQLYFQQAKELLLTAVMQSPASNPAQLAPAADQLTPQSKKPEASQNRAAILAKERSDQFPPTAVFHQILPSKNSIVQHWNYNLFLLGPSAKEPLACFL